MTHRLHWLTLLILLMLLTGALIACTANQPVSEPTTTIEVCSATMPDCATPSPAAEAGLRIYFFWGDGCPHCAKAKPFLDGVVERHPEVKLYAFEIYYEPDNRDLFEKMAAAYGFTPRAVPTIMVGDRYWMGFTDVVGREIETTVIHCLENGCPDPGHSLVSD